MKKPGVQERITEEFVSSGNASLCAECYGVKGDPAIILSAGATVSMLFWDAEFCRQLAGRGFFVIRYDNRDVGRSTYYEGDTIPYNIVDLADDAVAILDHYDVKEAHFVGMSLGGLVSQIVALRNPARVKSLVLIGTGPWGDSDPGIPEMDRRVLDFQAGASTVNWDDENDVVGYLLSGAMLMSGRKPFDRGRSDALIRSEYRRAAHYISMFNHAKLGGGEEYYNQLSKITQPALIIHGTDDLIWHFRHARVLERTLSSAELLVLNGTGHELHPLDWPLIIDGINRHAKRDPRP